MRGLLVVGLVLVLGVAGLWIAFTAGWLTNDEVAGDPAPVPRPAEVQRQRQAAQNDTMSSLGAETSKQRLRSRPTSLGKCLPRWHRPGLRHLGNDRLRRTSGEGENPL